MLYQLVPVSQNFVNIVVVTKCKVTQDVFYILAVRLVSFVSPMYFLYQIVINRTFYNFDSFRY